MKKIFQGIFFPIIFYITVSFLLDKILRIYFAYKLVIASFVCVVILYINAKYNKKLVIDCCFQNEKKINLKKSIYIIPIGFAFSIICNLVINIIKLENFFPTTRDVTMELVSSNIFLCILSGAIMAPLVEEVIFRGYIYKSLKSEIGVVTATIISALLFAMFHGNVLQGIYAFVSTFLFVYIYNKLENIYAIVFLHCICNASILFLAYAGYDMEMQTLRDKTFLLIICIAIFIMAIYRFNTVDNND